MSTLILTCSTGEGHNSCAKAIKEVYDAHGQPCEIVDALLFVSKWFSRFAHRVHTSMYQKHPKVFRVGYDYAQMHNGPTTSKGSIPYRILKIGVGRLHDYIIKNHITSIICVHPLLMMMVTALQKMYGDICQTAYVATDYTCSPGVKDSHPDICFISDDSLADEFSCENIPMKQIVPVGIPVRQQFYKNTEKNAAKQHFGISEKKIHLLMMCGSMGCGPMEKILELLHDRSDAYITVICGTNKELYNRLTEEYESCSHIQILGFVKEMSLLMDSADIFLTKPGGLSSTEAAVKRVPMVFVDAVGGCEDYNCAFFSVRGGAVAGETPEETAQLCKELIHDSEKRGAMKAALLQLQIPNTAEVIFETMQAAMYERQYERV